MNIQQIIDSPISKLLLPLLVIVCLIFLRGRGQSVPDCNLIYDSELSELLKAGTNEIYFVDWIQKNRKVEAEAIEVTSYSISWQQSDVRYYAETKNGNLLNVQARWLQNAPSGAELINCIGNPELYRAYHQQGPEAMITVANFWYGQEGIIYEAILFPTLFQRAPIPVYEETPFKYVFYYGVSSTRALFQKQYGDLSNRDQRQIRELLRNWVSWDALVIER